MHDNTEHPRPLLITIEEAARLLSLGRSKVYELVAAGEIPSVKVGTARRVSYSALEAWVAQMTEFGYGQA
jgi:excisionase family DNA binding protein